MAYSDNDMDNDIETKPKTRHSTSATKPGEVDKPWKNATELQETQSSHTTQSGRRVIKPSRCSIWWIANSENINYKRRMLCVTILFHHLVCVCVLDLSHFYVATLS